MNSQPTIGLPVLSDDDIRYMREAIAEAKLAKTNGDTQYGALVVDGQGTIIARSFDTVVRDGDPTAHAEFKVARAAYLARGRDLTDCTMYCNVEPCGMCFGAAWWAGLGRLMYGLSMAENKALCDESLEEVFGPNHALNDTLKRRIEIVGGALYDECEALWI